MNGIIGMLPECTFLRPIEYGFVLIGSVFTIMNQHQVILQCLSAQVQSHLHDQSYTLIMSE